MSTNLLTSAVSGMLAAQIGLQTTEHNISNQNTAGYNRQRILQASNIANLTGAGYIGQGAHVSTVERMYSQFLSSQVNTAQSSYSELSSYYSEISKIDNMLADSTSGLTPSLESFFSTVSKVAANPSLVSARQSMLSSAQSLVARYQSIESRLQELYAGVNSQLQTQVDTVNSYAAQIAELNQTIINAQSSTNQPANDLRDQRDQLVASLNKLISVEATTNTDGSYNVFFGTGQQLVVGTQVMKLTAAPSSSDSTRIAIGLSSGAAIQELPESLIAGGSIGGLLKFRSEALDPTANEVGRNAASLALAFNAQNALGQDLLGQGAGIGTYVSKFFTLSEPRVVANAHNSTVTQGVVSATLAAPSIDGYYTLALDGTGTTYSLTRQSDGKVWSATSLLGLNAKVQISEKIDLTDTGLTVGAGMSTQVTSAAANGANYYTKLTASDYRLSYDGTNYTMTRLSDSRAWSDSSLSNLSTTLAGSEGFSVALSSGAISAGDSFVIQPVREAARNLSVNAAVANDARLVAAGMAVKTAKASTNSGTGTITEGATVDGFKASAFPSGGISITYSSATASLDLGVTANVSVTASDGTTKVYTGPVIPYTSGATITVDGFSFSISGTLSNNDRFSLTSNSAGVSDSRNSVLLAKLQTQYTMSGETASLSGAYSQLVSFVGNKTRQISVTQDAQAALLDQSQSARDGVSGVNLDEEAANLIKYQQAYQASAKALQIGTNLFDTLIGIMN